MLEASAARKTRRLSKWLERPQKIWWRNFQKVRGQKRSIASENWYSSHAKSWNERAIPRGWKYRRAKKWSKLQADSLALESWWWQSSNWGSQRWVEIGWERDFEAKDSQQRCWWEKIRPYCRGEDGWWRYLEKLRKYWKPKKWKGAHQGKQLKGR